MNPYDDTDDEVVRTFGRVHANGEQTRVAILSVGERDYAAVAFDLRPSDFTPLAAATIGYDPTLEGAAERAERWMQNNPKGVAPGDGNGGGIVSRVTGAAKRLNDYGNDMTDDIQSEDKLQ